MNDFSEYRVCKTIGSWSTVPQLLNSSNNYLNKDMIDLQAAEISRVMIPGQVQAFITSNEKFIWFVEQYDIVASIDTRSGLPAANLINKKNYPAKVEGLSIPLFNYLNVGNNPSLAVTVRWRDGLIRHGSSYNQYSDSNIPCYRPGFGQQILGDLQRPIKSNTVICNNLNLIQSQAFQGKLAFDGPLGRIMAMAGYVNPTLAALYDTNQSKKKKKSLNSQDYEQIPTYPTYNTWVDNSGY